MPQIFHATDAGGRDEAREKNERGVNKMLCDKEREKKGMRKKTEKVSGRKREARDSSLLSVSRLRSCLAESAAGTAGPEF